MEQYIRSLGIPATFYMSGIYMSNLKAFTRKVSLLYPLFFTPSHHASQTEDGYIIAMPIPPTTKMPLIDTASDAGKFVAGILSSPSTFLNKNITGTSGWVTPTEFAAIISEVAGIKLTFKQLPDAVFRTLPPGQGDLGDMRLQAFMCLRDWGFYGADAEKQVEWSLKVCCARRVG